MCRITKCSSCVAQQQKLCCVSNFLAQKTFSEEVEREVGLT